MCSGWIKLHRKLIDSPVFTSQSVFRIWVYLLLKVNHDEKRIIWNGETKTIKKGSGIFSQRKISEETGLSIGVVNKALKWLNRERQISLKTNSKFTEIEVVKWDSYQEESSDREHDVNTKRTLRETNKNDKNDKNIYIGDLCQKFEYKYGAQMIKDFLRYWTEKAPKGKKERWEKEPTWDLERRLETWAQNEQKFNKKNFTREQKSNGPNGLVL